MVINAVGAVCTFIVMIVFAVTKFRDGAWVIVLLVPVLVFIFFRIHHHYKRLAKQLSLDEYGAPARVGRHRVILPSAACTAARSPLSYARALSDDVTAVYVRLTLSRLKR